MKRVPRKKKKKIPKGHYCYTPMGVKYTEKGFPKYKIKPCPFYKYVGGIEGHCSLLNCEVDDQVKECGEKS